MLEFNARRFPGRFPCAAGIQSPRGFSLLEVLLVLGLIALLTGLAWPSVAALQQRQDLDQACRDVISVVQRARSFALHSQSSVNVEQSVRGSRTIIQVTTGDGFIQKELPPGVRLTANHPKVLWMCQRDGRIRGDAIHLQDALGHAVWIDCHPLSGTVSIQRESGDRS